MPNPYAVMYDSTMDVYRYAEEEINSITEQKRELIAEKRPCRYSSSGQVFTEGDAPEIKNTHKLFCGLGEDIREGDHLIITMRTDKVVEVDLGECHPYTYQWQCEIRRADYI